MRFPITTDWRHYDDHEFQGHGRRNQTLWPQSRKYEIIKSRTWKIKLKISESECRNQLKFRNAVLVLRNAWVVLVQWINSKLIGWIETTVLWRGLQKDFEWQWWNAAVQIGSILKFSTSEFHVEIKSNVYLVLYVILKLTNLLIGSLSFSFFQEVYGNIFVFFQSHLLSFSLVPSLSLPLRDTL